MENENLTEFKIELDSVKISKTKNSKTSIELHYDTVYYYTIAVFICQGFFQIYQRF